MELSQIKVGRLYRHADGGLYRVLGFTRVKIQNGPWHEGVRYEFAIDEGPEFSTDFARFCHRFTPEVPEDQYELQPHE